MEHEGVQFLAVKSNFPKNFKGKFHGIEYAWKLGDTINMPVEAAEHIFGFGLEDKTRALHRAGFVNTMEDIEAGMAKLALFSFAPVEQVFELTQTRRARKARTARISDDRPPVNAVGSEGAVERPAPDDPDEDDDEDEDDERVEAG